MRDNISFIVIYMFQNMPSRGRWIEEEPDPDAFVKLDPLYSLDPNVRFMTACINGDLHHAVDTLDFHADVNKPGLDDLTGLMHAAREGHDAVVEILVARKECDINLSDKDGDTAFSHACCSGSYRVAKILLNCEGLEINTVDVDLVTPFHKAIANNHIDIVQLLLEHEDLKVKIFARS
jgi:ankyrin repeat protein